MRKGSGKRIYFFSAFRKACIFITVFAFALPAFSQKNPLLTPIGLGWSNNSVNAVIFRKNSISSLGKKQFVAYYDSTGSIMIGLATIGKRQWKLFKTNLHGNIMDAHNDISLIVDGKGYLHISWSEHGTVLNYARSKSPFNADFEKSTMIGDHEGKVTYPEFYRISNGDLLFLYRDGSSGNGNLVINRYDTQKKKWFRIQSNLLDGEGKRNAYWQSCQDNKEGIYLSWVWRESPDVSTNHDMCFAYSKDGGRNWQKSNGTPYKLPITASSAEYALKIPQNSELINQTSMCCDKVGNIYIASYWKAENEKAPQYHIIFKNKDLWTYETAGIRKSDFSLKGMGTKAIPISRPLLLYSDHGPILIFRDKDRNNAISCALKQNQGKWLVKDLCTQNFGSWEPTCDLNRWAESNILDLYAQPVWQGDGERLDGKKTSQVCILSWEP